MPAHPGSFFGPTLSPILFRVPLYVSPDKLDLKRVLIEEFSALGGQPRQLAGANFRSHLPVTAEHQYGDRQGLP